jgi:hypothetical protein
MNRSGNGAAVVGHAKDRVSAAVAAALTAGETGRVRGIYTAKCTGPRECDRARYVELRDRIAAEEAKPLAARDFAALNEMQDEFDAIPIEEKWDDEALNVVTYLGKNLMEDTTLAGSAYTTVGPYMGLISSVSWTNLATTISSLTSYTGSTVTLVTAAAHGLLPGDTFTIASATGTGTNVSAVNGTWTAIAGTTGSTLVFNIGVSGLTITTLTGGPVTTTSGTRINDTMASHANWTEAGSTNAPTFSARGTLSWSAAASGTKSTSSATSFSITGAGTLQGCFLVTGTGAVNTLMSTAGTLFSGGAFTGGSKVVANGDTVNVSYSISI